MKASWSEQATPGVPCKINILRDFTKQLSYTPKQINSNGAQHILLMSDQYTIIPVLLCHGH